MEHQQIFCEIINNTHSPIMVLDDNWIIKIFNTEAEALTGYKAEEVIGIQSIKNLIVNSSTQEKLFERLVRINKVNDYETYLIRKDKKKIPVILSLSKIYHKDSSSYDILTIILDFTNRKKIEQKYMQKIKELEEISLASTELIRKRYDLYRLVKHDYDNSYMVSTHFIDYLSSGMMGDLNEMQKNKLQDIRLEFDKVRKRIYDLDYLYRVDLKNLQINRQKHTITELFIPIFENFSAVYSRKGYELKNNLPPDLPPVYCDKNIISQIFFELLADAIRDSGVGGVISISAKKSTKYNKKLEIYITAQAPEMSEEDRAFFESLMKNTEKKQEKAIDTRGIGIIFCLKILETIGEKLWFEKQSYSKSTVYFTLEYIAEQ